MAEIVIRKDVLIIEEIRHEGGPPAAAPAKKGAIVTVIANPFAGRHEPDIAGFMDDLKPLGVAMAMKLIDALGGDPKAIQGYGKGAIVGVGGEIEHGALWHVPGGYAMREALGGALAIVPSTKKVGAVGARLDVPITHIDASYVRSAFRRDGGRRPGRAAPGRARVRAGDDHRRARPRPHRRADARGHHGARRPALIRAPRERRRDEVRAARGATTEGTRARKSRERTRTGARTMKHLTHTALAVVLATAGLASAAQAQETREFRIGMITPPAHVWNQEAAALGETLSALTDGRFTVAVFPSGQLGNEATMLQQLQTGALDMAFLTTAEVTTRVPDIAALHAPFLVDDIAGAAAILRSEPAQEMLEKLPRPPARSGPASP